MKEIILWSIYIVFCIGVTSCDTRRDIYNMDKATVNVTIDWTNLESQPKGATVIFFPQSSSDDPIYWLTNNTSGSVAIPVGSYNIICFNESITGHDNILFRNTDDYFSFEAYLKTYDADDKYYTKESRDKIVKAANILAVATMEEFTIIRKDVINKREYSIYFKPVNLVHNLQLTSYIVGMDNAAKSGSTASVSGLAESINLSSGEITTSSITQLISLTKKVFDQGSYKTGYMRGCTQTFGDVPNGQNIATLHFHLRDDSDHTPIAIDVTNEIKNVNDNLYIDIYKITLPEVEDIESPGQGFDATISPWEPETEVDVII